MKFLRRQLCLLSVLLLFGAARSQTPAKAEHRFRPGDELTVSWPKDLAELDWTGEVDADGNIELPFIDNPIRAVCRTAEDLQQEVNRQYANFVKKPAAQVALSRRFETAEPPVLVMGAVKEPGRFLLNRRVLLSEILAAAGGPNERAGKSVRLVPTTNFFECRDDGSAVNLEAEASSYPLAAVLRKDPAADVAVHHGDVITVLETELVYINGVVKTPAALKFFDGMTIKQAVAQAGGVNGTVGGIRIKRRNGDETIELNFDWRAIQQSAVPTPLLQANDIIFVLCQNCGGRVTVCESCLPLPDVVSVINKTPLKVIE
jgi:polysaccharide export outer membrane protein